MLNTVNMCFSYGKSRTHKRVLFQGYVPKSSKVGLGTQLTVTHIVLHSTEFIILFRQTVHKSQTQEVRETILP